MPETSPNPEAEGYATAYRQHATSLRNWLVAYGVGGPALFLTNDKLRDALKASGCLQLVGWTFLLGVALQVCLSFLDKYADWICYQRCLNPNWPESRASRLAAWWVDANAPSIVIELASMILFAVATVAAFQAAF